MNQPAFRQTSATAIVSLISGLLGWTLLPFLGGFVAVVTGHMARADIRRNPQTLQGDGFAVAGLILGYAVIAFSLLALVALVLFGGLAAMLALGHWG